MSSFFGENSDRQVPDTWMYRRTQLLAEVSKNTDKCGSLNHGSSVADSVYSVLLRILLLAGVSNVSLSKIHGRSIFLRVDATCSDVSKVSLLAGMVEMPMSMVLRIRDLLYASFVYSKSPEGPLLAAILKVCQGIA